MPVGKEENEKVQLRLPKCKLHQQHKPIPNFLIGPSAGSSYIKTDLLVRVPMHSHWHLAITALFNIYDQVKQKHWRLKAIEPFPPGLCGKGILLNVQTFYHICPFFDEPYFIR